jgi:V8-like Glu-specific endopeptidase
MQRVRCVNRTSSLHANAYAFCSGTLIEPDVFLTAAHCTAFLDSIGVAPDDV